jgi:hypothetical protein
VKYLRNKIKKYRHLSSIFRIVSKKMVITKNKLDFMLFVLVNYRKRFHFHGNEYFYFYNNYNTTWKNERAVEIPIALNLLKKNKTKKILEVGNVLSHYYSINHRIVDKFEKAKSVINEDISTYKTDEKFDLIICISTIEHIGNVEENRESTSDPLKILYSIENMKMLLGPGGKIFLTFPLGYNKNLDYLFEEKKLSLNKYYFLKRVSEKNEWIETKSINSNDIKYGFPFPKVNILIIGCIEKDVI